MGKLPSLQGVYTVKAHLSESDGHVLDQNRIVIPATQRALKQITETDT